MYIVINWLEKEKLLHCTTELLREGPDGPLSSEASKRNLL